MIIDVLVTSATDEQWSLFDWVKMQDELKILPGRDVDIAEKAGFKNPYRRREFLTHYQVIYAQPES